MLGDVVGRGLPLDGNAVAGSGGHLDAPVLDGGRERVRGCGAPRHAAVVKRILEGIADLVEGSDKESVRSGLFQAFELVRSEPGFFLDHLPGVAGHTVQFAPHLVADLALLGEVVGRGFPLDGKAVERGVGHHDAPALDGGRRLVSQGIGHHKAFEIGIAEDVAGLIEGFDIEIVPGVQIQAGECKGGETLFFRHGLPGVARSAVWPQPNFVSDLVLFCVVVCRGFPRDGNTVVGNGGHPDRQAIDGGRNEIGRLGPYRQATPVHGILADQAGFVKGLDEDAIAGVLFQVLESKTAEFFSFLDDVPGIGRILFFRDSDLVVQGIGGVGGAGPPVPRDDNAIERGLKELQCLRIGDGLYV